MLVGSIPSDYEPQMFQFLCDIEAFTVIEPSDSIGCSKSTTFRIDLKDPQCKPVQHDVRRCSQQKQVFIDKTVDKMLEQGIAEAILSDWCSGVVVVPKPGRGDDYRLCVDLIDVNDRTTDVKFPVPNVEEILFSLGKAKYFMKFDLAKGYWQVPVEEDSRKYLTFITRRGTYCFLRMPFGAKNAPAVFQKMMNEALGPTLYKECFVFFDDIIVFGSTIEELLERGRNVVFRLFEDNLKLSGLKSEFLIEEVELLGRIIKDGCVLPKMDKLQGLRDLRQPTNVSEVRSVYGLLSYFRIFVENFSRKCKPITDCLKMTDADFVWSSKSQESMLSLIDEIGEACLSMPQFDLPFIVQTDFSYEGLGAVLMQHIDGRDRPILFASRTLIDAEKNYSPTEGEALAILFALKRFSYFLQGQKVILRTDHRPLTFMKHGSENNRKLARWWSELQQFDISIEYVEGRNNVVPDCMSRLTTHSEPVPLEHTLGLHRTSQERVWGLMSATCAACSESRQSESVECDNCDRVYHLECLGDDHFPLDLPFWYCRHCKPLLTSADPATDVHLLEYLCAGEDITALVSSWSLGERYRVAALARKFEVVSGILYNTESVELRQVVSLRRRLDVLADLHQVCGHVGIVKLFAASKRYYYWTYLFEDCVRAVKRCRECQLLKATPLYKPLTTTYKFQQPFQVWAIDYLPKLPTSPDGYSHCLIMVDAFSKWVELIPAKTKSSVEVAQILELHLLARFGLPVELRSDRGTEFSGAVTQLCERYGIKHIRISRMHPQANGQAERYVGVVKAAISRVLKEKGLQRNDWVHCIPACLMGMRFFQQRVLGLTPFTMICGQSPRLPLLHPQRAELVVTEGNTNDIALFIDDLASHMRFLHDENVHRLSAADTSMTEYYNKKKPLLGEFEEGQLVLVRNYEVGVFHMPLLGPFRFLRYKNAFKYVAVLQDGDFQEFEMSIAHVVPFITI